MRTLPVRLRAFVVMFAIIVVSILPACARRSPILGSVPTDPGENDARSALRTSARRGNDDVALEALLVEPARPARGRVRALLERINAEAGGIRTMLGKRISANEAFAGLNEHFFGPAGFAALGDLSAPENVSVAAVLENRRGTCVGLAIVYLALAHRLGLDAHAVATPVHLFVRVRVGDAVRNVELLEAGREIDDDTYRRRYRIDEANIAAGAFMKELTSDEVIAHLLSNQAVTLSRQGKLAAALRRYGRALKLHPTLAAAWYNHGIDLMNAGRLKDALASFNRAIELCPSDAQAHNNRGLARLKLGDAEGARADFQRALAIDPSLKEAEENLKRLLSGRASPR